MNHQQIGLFLYSLDSDGVERMFSILANEFINRGFRVDLMLAKASGPYLSDLSSKIRVIDSQCQRTPAALLKLAFYLRRERPDFLITSMY